MIFMRDSSSENPNFKRLSGVQLSWLNLFSAKYPRNTDRNVSVP